MQAKMLGLAWLGLAWLGLASNVASCRTPSNVFFDNFLTDSNREFPIVLPERGINCEYFEHNFDSFQIDFHGVNNY